MTLTKRDLVIRISEETGLIQQQVLTVAFLVDALGLPPEEVAALKASAPARQAVYLKAR